MNAAEKFEEDVARNLTIPRLDIPGPEHWKATLTPRELDEFPAEARPVLFAMSRLEHKIDFTLEWMVTTNRHQRRLEAIHIRNSSIRYNLGKWVMMTIGAGALLAVGNKAVSLLFK